jgi:glutathionyl-hydroquinone reductase
MRAGADVRPGGKDTSQACPREKHTSHENLNPHRIIPISPLQDFAAARGR